MPQKTIFLKPLTLDLELGSKIITHSLAKVTYYVGEDKARSVLGEIICHGQGFTEICYNLHL